MRLSDDEIKVIENIAGIEARHSVGKLMTLGQRCLDVIWELRATRGDLTKSNKRGVLAVAQAFYVSDSALNTPETWGTQTPKQINAWINHAETFMDGLVKL